MSHHTMAAKCYKRKRDDCEHQFIQNTLWPIAIDNRSYTYKTYLNREKYGQKLNKDDIFIHLGVRLTFVIRSAAIVVNQHREGEEESLSQLRPSDLAIICPSGVISMFSHDSFEVFQRHQPPECSPLLDTLHFTFVMQFYGESCSLNWQNLLFIHTCYSRLLVIRSTTPNRNFLVIYV